MLIVMGYLIACMLCSFVIGVIVGTFAEPGIRKFLGRRNAS